MGLSLEGLRSRLARVPVPGPPDVGVSPVGAQGSYVARRLREWYGGLSLLFKFSVFSFILMAAIAVSLAWGLQSQLEQSALKQEAENAGSQVAYVVNPNLTMADLRGSLTPQRFAQINDLFKRYILLNHVVRVKIWGGDGTLLYSDDPSLIGRKFPADDAVGSALSGQVVSSVSNLQAEENVAERGKFSRLLEIYEPLQPADSTKPEAVYEIYRDTVEVDTRIADTRTFLFGSIAAGFFVLYTALFTLVANASRTLTRRNTENRRLYEETREQLMERRRAEAALRHRSEFESLIMSISTDFLNLAPAEVDIGISNALQAIGEFNRVDRAYVYLFSSAQREFLELRHQWCAPGARPISPELRRVRISEMPEWVGDLERLQVIHIPDTALLAGANLNSGHTSSAKSLLAVPLVYNHALVGFLGVDTLDEARTWPEESITLLRIVGEIFVNALERKRSEELLRSSEVYFRSLIENAQDVITVLNADGTIRYQSPSTERVLGYKPDELLGHNMFSLMNPDDVAAVAHSFGDLMQPHTTNRAIEFRYRHKDGGWRYFESTGKNLLADPQVRGVVINSRDSTERKEAEVAQRASEQRFHAIFAGAGIGIGLSDMQGHIVESNSAFQQMLGYSGDELRELTFAELTHPDDVNSNVNLFHDLREEKIEQYRMVKRYMRKDGSVLWANLNVSLLHDEAGAPQYSIALVENITEQKRANEQVKLQLQRLAALRSVDMAISSTLDLHVTLDVVLDKVISQLGVDAAHVMLLNPHTQLLQHAAGCGFRHTAIMESEIELGEGYSGRAALQRRTLNIPDLRQPHELKQASRIEGEDFVSYYVVPLVAKGQVEGVLEVFHRANLEPDAEWLDFLEALAGQAAIAVDNATLFDDLQRSNTDLALAYDSTLEGWSHALDLRDHETEGHTQRVAEMTMRLARKLGVAESEMVQIHRGALLHDIGKMGIPDAILLKPGPLTDEEWEIMRRHPVYAFELLSPIEFLRPALDIPYCHHEKWDGTGYPRGLKGEQIPMPARIFAIVDVYDALRSDRPYRASWPEEKVREHIQGLSGTHFDPQIVRAFLELTSSTVASATQGVAFEGGPICWQLALEAME